MKDGGSHRLTLLAGSPPLLEARIRPALTNQEMTTQWTRIRLARIRSGNPGESRTKQP